MPSPPHAAFSDATISCRQTEAAGEPAPQHPQNGARCAVLHGKAFMTTVRSILFNTAFYANLILRMIVLSPIYFLLPRRKAPIPSPRTGPGRASG